MADSKKSSGYVMVIEDDKLLLEAIQEKLTAEKIDHKCFLDGTTAMKKMIDGGEHPSLIWLDYYLGDTNGLSLMAILKKNDKLKDIPVLIVSNSTSGDKIKALLDLGADEYLVKANYSLKEIIAKVRKFIDKK